MHFKIVALSIREFLKTKRDKMKKKRQSKVSLVFLKVEKSQVSKQIIKNEMQYLRMKKYIKQ